MKQLDNYLVALAMTVQKLGMPLRDDGWPAVPIKGSAVAFHLGRFIYHAARITISAEDLQVLQMLPRKKP